MASTRDALGERATLEALISGDITGGFEEDSAVSLGPNALRSTGLTSVTLPNVTRVSDASFSGSTIMTIDFGRMASMGNASGANMLEALVLRNPRRVGSVGNFVSGTFIRLGAGAVYVPDHLVDSYNQQFNGSGDKSTVMRRALTQAYTPFMPLSEYPTDDHSTIRESWADIIASVNAGTHADRYYVGDSKLLELADGTKVYMMLMAMDTDTLADGAGRAAMTWLCRGICPHERAMDSTRSHLWPDTDLRAWLREELLPLFPAVVRRAVRPVTKHYLTSMSEERVDGETVATRTYGSCTDTIWIPSSRELSNYSAIGYTDSPDANYVDSSYSGLTRSSVDGNRHAIWSRDAYDNGGGIVSRQLSYYTASVSYSYVSPTSTGLVAFGFCI